MIGLFVMILYSIYLRLDKKAYSGLYTKKKCYLFRGIILPDTEKRFCKKTDVWYDKEEYKAIKYICRTDTGLVCYRGV